MTRMLSDEELKAAESAALDAAKNGDSDLVWQSIEPILASQARNRDAALALLRIVDGGSLSHENTLRILTDIEEHHSDDIEIVGHIGFCLEEACDTVFLNRAPPEESLFGRVVETLTAAMDDPLQDENRPQILRGLATAARMMARQGDDVAEAAYKRLVELQPESSSAFYCLGLFLKTRGRFREGMLANLRAAELAVTPTDAMKWNIGICATGAGDGATALNVWLELGNKLAIGRFDLPDGRYPSCKVRLAERPLAERNAENDDPGLEETIWIERLSPCHGIVRSVLYDELGVDYGDVILIDGAPITYHRYGDDEIPVFPHLATLVRGGYQFFDFAGIQVSEGQLGDLSRGFREDIVIYSHTERMNFLCASCWRDAALNHEHNETLTKHVVLGRIAAPEHISAAGLLQEIDLAVGGQDGCALYAPALASAAGLDARAVEEERLFELLQHSGPAQ